MIKTKKYIKTKNNKTKKIRKINFINNPNNYEIIKYNGNIKNIQSTILSSIFLYFYGKIKIINTIDNSSKKIKLTKSFLNLKNVGSILIIDYANIIHILYEKYKKHDIVIKKFYNFLYKQLEEKSKIFIICKPFTINKYSYDIVKILNIGKYISNKTISEKYFLNEELNIYIIDQNNIIQSSIDDLITQLLCFVLMVYLLNSNKNPNKYIKNDNYLKKINLITNDKQLFDKNLFGKTFSEIKNHINYCEINIKKVYYNSTHQNYYSYIDLLDELLIRHFLKNFVITIVNDNKFLDCNIMLLIELLLKDKNKKMNLNGYYRDNYIDPEYNPNITKNNILKFGPNDFSYDNLNKLQKKGLQKDEIQHNNVYMDIHPIQICKPYKHITENNSDDLKKYMYLYVFIKYTQLYLNSVNYDNVEYGNFFGSFSVDNILHIFN